MKHLKKFNENEYDKVSSQIGDEQVNDIISKIESIDKDLDTKKHTLDELSKILSKYKTDDNKNTQLDDAYLKITQSISDIENLISNLDDANAKLKDYLENGEQYLY